MDRNTSSSNWQDHNGNSALEQYYTGRMSPLRRAVVALRRELKMSAWRAVVRSSYALKRALDLVGGFAAVFLLSPIFLATWLAIKLEDGGPALFVQVRVGLRGRHFRMFKFRSMVVDADRRKDELLAQNESGGGVLFKMKRDPRITRVGQVIRKLSIDEFPQFFNVLRGEMSLVGPRPALPREVKMYRQSDRIRLDAKPGITCFWQVGGRSEIDFDGQVQLDLEYIRAQSFWLDVWLLVKTVPAVLFGKGAY